jgi:D-sedoheptulose 7-phosphate isomerase
MDNKVRKAITAAVAQNIVLTQKISGGLLSKIELSIGSLTRALEQDKKILIFGNGGSAADSQHMAAELIGRFNKDRKAFSAVALTTDTSTLTSIGNDYGFENIFSRQIDGLGKKGDIAFAISTSGNSRNILNGLRSAKKAGLKTIALLGSGGGAAAKLADISMIVPSDSTPRIQEVHQLIIHIICEILESALS